ncbi:hypothetical protein NUACC21_56260 [Scytonema sp. NUACC21]
MIPLPESARVVVPSKLATDLLSAVKKLPLYDDKALYDVKLQATVREQIRTLIAGDGFDWLVEEIRKRLIRKPYCAYVTGLQFDDPNLVFFSLAGAFGDVVDDPYNPSSRLVRDLQPSTDKVIPDGWGVLNEQLHTDSTDWPEPNALTCLHCIRPDYEGGGRSRLLDIDTLLVELDKRFGQEVLKILHTEAVPWWIADKFGGGVLRTPVFTANSVRWLPYTIKFALENNQESLPETISASLGAMENVLNEATGIIDFAMAPGSLWFINNKLSLHSRTPIKNPQASKRLVLRTKIQHSSGFYANTHH